MPAPIDYLGLQQTGSPIQSLIQGLQTGGAIREARTQANAEALARQYQEDVQAAFQSGDARAFAQLQAKYPQQGKALREAYDSMDKVKREQEFGSAMQVYSALKNGNPDAANSVLDQHIAAGENSGEDVSDLKNIKLAIAQNPQNAANIIALHASTVDPDRWSKIATEQRAAESAPYELTEKQAKAQKAAIDSRFAESNAALDLQKKGWDIQKIQSDMQLGKLNSQIAAMNAQANREQNDLKRQELQQKLQDKQIERDAAVRTKASDIESGRASIDNMLNTAHRILQTPSGVVSSAAGPISSKTPTLREDTADFEELVNTLGSQAFMAQIPNLKGMGALSNAEGEKLQSALQNLSLRQSPERLIENVKEAQRIILKSRQNLSEKYGVPDTIPDVPAATKNAPGMPQGFKVLGVEGQ